MVRGVTSPERKFPKQRKHKQSAKEKLGRGKPAPSRRPPSESPVRYEPAWLKRFTSPVIIVAGIAVIIGMFTFTTFHWNDEWGPFGLAEGLFACTLVPNILISRRWGTLETPMGIKRTAPRALILFLILVLSQAAVQIRFTITTWERALYTDMAPFAEEFFFRGFVARVIAGKDNNKARGVVAVGVSTTLFAAAHVGYYNNLPAMIWVVGFGITFGVAYLCWKDMNALVIAHFVLNFIVSLQILYQVIL